MNHNNPEHAYWANPVYFYLFEMSAAFTSWILYFNHSEKHASSFEAQNRCHLKSKKGVSLAQQEELMSSENFLTKKIVNTELSSKETIHIISFEPISKKRAPKSIH